MRVSEMIEELHTRIQVKLAQQGMPPDRETLAEVCTAIACLVRDPDGLQFHSSPLSAEDYAVVQDCLSLATRDFAEEITLLRTFVAALEEAMQAEVQHWVASGQVTSNDAPEVIRELVLARFVDLDENGDAPDRGNP
jgi:hypothetical protein